MKKLLPILIAVVLICMMLLPACSSEPAPAPAASTEPTEPEVSAAVVPEDLNILCIGNSFSCDTIEHVADIALDLGVSNVKLGNLYVGGCSIKKHYYFATNNRPEYEYLVNTGDGWSSTYNRRIIDVLKSEDWDWISIQHGTADGSRYAEEDSYEKLPALVQYIKKYANDDAKIAFNMTWVGERGSHEELTSVYANNQLKYYKAIAALTRDTVLTTGGIDCVSPTGTAIQNARTADLGVLTRDGYHLSYDVGRYIAGLTFFKALTGVDISGITWAPEGVSDYAKSVAVESATNAVNTPFEVTSSALTKE